MLSFAVDRAGNGRHRLALSVALDNVRDQGGKALLRLNRARKIHEPELAMKREPHGVLPVGAAEDDLEPWIRRFDPPGERQRSDVLLERGGESDHVVIVPRDRGQAMVDKDRRHALDVPYAA